MKSIYKLFISLLLVLSLLLLSTMLADESEYPQNIDKQISELIYYYGEKAHTDVMITLDQMEEKSSKDYNLWYSVIEKWDWIENEMQENTEVAPDGLPDNDKHTFVVLGFALKNDGTMKDELIGRLEVALNSAEKYPDSYILVTGGVENNGWTEGDRMRDWLVDHGISEDRIIIENEASNTVGNAANSFELMYNDYDIDTFSMITSQYHLKRGSIFYYTMSQLKAKELDKDPIEFLGEGNAGWYQEDKTKESLSLKTRGMFQIADVDKPVELPVSKLKDLNIEGDLKYSLSDKLNLKVYGQYDNDYERDVTEFADISEFDSSETGEQKLEVAYEENNEIVTENIKINVEEPSPSSMQQKIENLNDKDNLADNETARLLDTHISAVKRFDETDQTAKVQKHLSSFKKLLEYQREEDHISNDAYDSLNSDSEYLIDEAS